MTHGCTALHIRTGDPSCAEAIDAWLAAQSVDAVICSDAFDACVHLLKRAEQVPDLVFIGADWLAPDEHEIIRYTRETWPAVGVVIYGAPLNVTAAVPLTLVCRSRAELTTLLAGSLAAALERFPRDAEPLHPKSDGAAGVLPASRPDVDATAAGALRDALTREELSALLDDDDR